MSVRVRVVSLYQADHIGPNHWSISKIEGRNYFVLLKSTRVRVVGMYRTFPGLPFRT